MFSRRLTLCLAAGTLCSSAAAVQGQAYTSMVVFGDSLSDTGNFAQLSENNFVLEIPGPLANYTAGRFTDGSDTVPAARLYKGVWVEQLAASLPAKPAVEASLDGGTDYAYGSALSSTGTTNISFGPFNAFTDTVKNTGLQVSAYLAGKPEISPRTLFVLWSGANDLLSIPANANAAAVAATVKATANENLASVQRLIAAGATDILMPELPPLGVTPELNGNAATSNVASAAALAYNEEFLDGLAALPAQYPGKTLHLYTLDTYSLFESLATAPSLYGLVNVAESAQLQPVDPDTWLFWDGLHPTTAGHRLLAQGAKNLLTQTAASSTVLTLGANKVAARQNVALSARVTGSNPTPTGIVTFYNGAKPVAAAELNAAGIAAATYVAGPSSGSPYTLTAHYAGDAVHKASISAAETLTIAPPGYTFTASPNTFALPTNDSAATTLTLTPAAGLAGSFKVACGTLPAHVACSFSATSFSFSGNDKPETSKLTLQIGSAAATGAFTIPVVLTPVAGGTSQTVDITLYVQ